MEQSFSWNTVSISICAAMYCIIHWIHTCICFVGKYSFPKFAELFCALFLSECNKAIVTLTVNQMASKSLFSVVQL